MPPSSISTCSSLIPAYNAWKESLSVLKDTKEVFQRENTEESRIELERAMGDVMSTKESFLSLSQTPSLYQNNPCTALEVLALETMERMIGESPRVESKDGRISATRDMWEMKTSVKQEKREYVAL